MRIGLFCKAIAIAGVFLLCPAPAAPTADNTQKDDQKQTSSDAAPSGQHAAKNSGTGFKSPAPNQRTTAGRTGGAEAAKDQSPNRRTQPGRPEDSGARKGAGTGSKSSQIDAKKPVTVYRPPTGYRRPGAYQPYPADPYSDPSYYLPYLPPLYLPPDVLYGPQSPPSSSSGGTGSTLGGRAASDKTIDAAIEARVLSSAGSSPGGRSWLFISFGDGHFAAGRHAEAYERYCGAAQMTPNLADAYFRQGFALSALGRYDAAVQAFLHGLALDSTWAKSGFRLKDLYRTNQTAKQTQVDRLAKAATDEPGNADLLLLVGLHLWCDGQRDRASPFFQRAVQLGADPTAFKGFLPAAK